MIGTVVSSSSSAGYQWQAQEPPQPPVEAAGDASALGAELSLAGALSVLLVAVSVLLDAGAGIEVEAPPPLKSVAYQPEPFN